RKFEVALAVQEIDLAAQIAVRVLAGIEAVNSAGRESRVRAAAAVLDAKTVRETRAANHADIPSGLLGADRRGRQSQPAYPNFEHSFLLNSSLTLRTDHAHLQRRGGRSTADRQRFAVPRMNPLRHLGR